MLKISGNKIYWNKKFQKGTLIKTENAAEFIPEILEGEFYEGLICPGLVNAHCHLELSHLKNVAHQVKGKGMAFFITWVQKMRNHSLDIQEEAIQDTLESFQKEGTFFIGDICNSLVTQKIKKEYQTIYFRNFWEVFGLNPEISEEKWQQIQEDAQKLQAFISLHAPYSCSKNLIEKVHNLLPKLQSIHMAESQEELEYFRENSSKLWNTFKIMGIPSAFLEHKLPFSEAILSKKTRQYLLVHNVFLDTTKISEEILEHCYFCICPTSNMFLHNQTISEDFLHSWKHKICLGTDSYASNDELSVLKEMNYWKKLDNDAENIVLMATHNGYNALLIPDDVLHSYLNIVHIYEDKNFFQTQVLCG